MKKLFFIPIVITSFVLCSCGGATTTSNSTEESYSQIDPDTVDGDGYEYNRPDKSEDGVILQAFNWKFSQIKEELPYLADAGFKMIQTSPIQQPKSNGTSWWAFYQPLGFSIADNSPLGTKQELKELCEEADKYNISIISDIVFNHLANITDSITESDGTPKVSPDVEKYEPEIYKYRNDGDADGTTFHHEPKATGSGAVTQVYAYGNLPDLNTGHPLVQKRALDLLKEAIDVGVDGFRFDAAKHIETPDDPDHASNFWPNVLGEAEKYYKEKTGKNLFAYGEILGGPDGGRSIDCYAKLMHVTDDGYISNIKNAVGTKDAERLVNNQYSKKSEICTTNKLVPWVESHDTYIQEQEKGNNHIANDRVAKMWVPIAARKDTNPVYLARPDQVFSVGVNADLYCETQLVGQTNRFHNRFAGADENIFAADANTYVVERFNDKDCGAMALVMNTDAKSVVINFKNLKDGYYFDEMTGSVYEVKDGSTRITNIDASGIVCLTKSKEAPHPIIEVSSRGGSFIGSKNVTLTARYANKAEYSLNNGEFVLFTGTKTVALVSDTNEVTLTVRATNGNQTYERTYKYTKENLIEGYFNILNFNKDYVDNNEVYFWAWQNGQGGKWLTNISHYDADKGVLLLDFSSTSYDNFLIGLFDKGHEIANVDAWDNDCRKQTSDIQISAGYYDAAGF